MATESATPFVSTLPILPTARLTLRPITPADSAALYELRGIRSVYQWTLAGVWTSPAQADEMIAYHRANEFTAPLYVIEESRGGAFVGTLGAPRALELGYMLAPGMWGKGYATEAVDAFFKWWFGREPVEGEEEGKWTAWVDSGNPASLKILTRMGFVEVERLEWENPTLGRRLSIRTEMGRGDWERARKALERG
ncbi:acyl-CoA N-acyltransferase [Trichodelitschia bisporula]|uniref:Acyl-CoA N-acyltransferase n=1 Tax=Trichodelitschia bisporula TaxID=703511 RepID=A0A6G1I3S3_9PEZI|nr:acyl-CoA N-acyltransferase [Trichodelitschia bisporula]